jgi:O-methyltransferase involved in polyketide biosynthesis
VVDEWSEHDVRRRKAAQVDNTVPNVARAWNYLVGGRDNFEVDRKAARQLIAIAPVMSALGPAAREFQRRLVRFLAAEAGIRQFLDVGTGMPTTVSTHEVAQAVAPSSRIVYVDNDPVVIAHARALLTSSAEGLTSYLDLDARNTAQLIAGAARCLDLSEPVAVILMGVLSFIDPLDVARSVARELATAIPPGSFIAIHHAASDMDPSVAAAARLWNSMSQVPRLVPRTRAEVKSLLDGLDLVAPGIVPVDQWRPDAAAVPDMLPLYGALARKL